MKPKNQKTIEERIEELIRYYASDQFGDTPLIGEILIPPETIPALEAGIKRLISDILREVIGEDIPNPYDQPKIEGINYEKQEIRQRAKRLGLEV